jgi:hypothetical protein
MEAGGAVFPREKIASSPTHIISEEADWRLRMGTVSLGRHVE